MRRTLIVTEARPAEGKLLPSQFQLTRPRQPSKASLGPLGSSAVGETPGSEEGHRATSRRITRTSTGVVFGHAAGQIGGDAGIQRPIGAAHDVEKPGVQKNYSVWTWLGSFIPR